MIRMVEARKHYGGREEGVEALRGVGMEVPRGEFLAIMGPSGCGKSTLLHVLGGLDRLSSGEAWLNGQALHTLNEKGFDRLRRETIGFVFQFFNLLPTLTVEENVHLPGLLAGRDAAEVAQRGARLLGEVGLEHRRKHQTHQLSGGEMQRAALARALLLNPPVLLADEPTGNLDTQASGRVVELLRRLGREQGTTIVMVTHSREVAAAADRILEMRDGQVVGDRRNPREAAAAPVAAS
jgi:ABC-type lipoprotein export system ATPase subunit